jgi:hypothetical protein
MTPPKPPTTTNPWNIWSPSCAGRGCTPAAIGAATSGLGVGLYPVARNLPKLNVLSHLWSGAMNDAPIFRNMQPDVFDRFVTSIPSKAQALVKAGRITTGVSVGLSVLGGGIQAYGEWNSSHGDWAKTVAVGGADTGINIGASLIGNAAGPAIVAGGTSVVTGLLSGTEMGAEIGTVMGGPVGTIAGAIVGAAVGAGLAYLGGNVVNDIINLF